MANLSSIDLTQGRKFERYLDEKESKKLRLDDRGVHRLKKGEIPHFSSNNSYASTLSDWVITTSDINNTVITFNTEAFDLTAVTTWNDYSFGNTWVVDTPAITNTDVDVFGWGTSYINSSSTKYYYNTKCNITEDYSILGRIKSDPFKVYEVVTDGRDYLHKLKPSLKKLSSMITLNYSDDIMSRLRQDDNKHNFYIIPNESKSLLSRLHELDNESSLKPSYEAYEMDNTERNLRRKAPFINRVYTMNRGRSFDSTEFNFDMVLAEEHFNTSLTLSNL